MTCLFYQSCKVRVSFQNYHHILSFYSTELIILVFLNQERAVPPKIINPKNRINDAKRVKKLKFHIGILQKVRNIFVDV